MQERDFRMIETNGIRLRTVVAGSGPLVILLHGFPQCWYLWRHQIDPIVRAGFQVAVPDQCGYGGSDRPEPIEAYNIIELTRDVAGLADALEHEQFIVVGHDWTGARRWRGTLPCCIPNACGRCAA
jgi:pimeloyl-ACP methyl ester carboxylesterase